ncbi:hypothetical protein ACPPVV_02100 [Rhodanobacter sp. Col0626]|uniref:hypothetical protein n=1 Tax=Rhodanobacter sp. Col0626 TaxID=3415679 RepID=UPI003CF354F0
MALRVLLIGASGVFGTRIACELAHDPRFSLTLAGEALAALVGFAVETQLETLTS